MNFKYFKKMNKLSRRSFLSGSAAALATASLAPIATSCQTGPVIPGIDEFGSKFGGVQIGAITYSWRSMPGGLENIAKYCKESGINHIELMSADLETFLGAPARPQGPPRRRAEPGQELPPPTPEEQAEIDAAQVAQEQYNAAVKAFRLGVSAERIAAAKKLFDDAGIGIHIVKFSPSSWSDEEIDYAFTTAKALGANAVCEEVSDRAATKLAPFAAKHGMYAILHNHQQFAQADFNIDTFLAVSPSIKLNFDQGHYYGSTGKDPCEFIRKYHDRIYSIHIKDKTGPTTDPSNYNQVWGQGETPLKEVLLLIKKEGWPIYMDIELEYDIKPWSNAVKEVRNCVQWARNVLI